MRSPRSCTLVAPRPRTARQLADRFEVSVRTIERDLGALMEAGVPVYATPGPGGGYAVDRTRTLPPVNFSPDEATALALALARSGDSPFAGRLRSALRKVVGAMSPDDADRARHLVDRVRLLGNVESERSAAAAVIEDAVMAEQVVEIDYIDRDGAGTTRASSSRLPWSPPTLPGTSSGSAGSAAAGDRSVSTV